MNCCNEYEGTCTQGRDCPIRKQRIKQTDDAYINKGSWAMLADKLADGYFQRSIDRAINLENKQCTTN